MFKKEDYTHKPDMLEIAEYVDNSLWNKFGNYMIEKYQIEPQFDFSKCSLEYGWNVKFKKHSKTLCTLYPKENYFIVMIVIGRKEKEQFEAIQSSLSPDIKKLYLETKEVMNQKWLMIELEDDDKRYNDVKKIIDIRNK